MLKDSKRIKLPADDPHRPHLDGILTRSPFRSLRVLSIDALALLVRECPFKVAAQQFQSEGGEMNRSLVGIPFLGAQNPHCP